MDKKIIKILVAVIIVFLVMPICAYGAEMNLSPKFGGNDIYDGGTGNEIISGIKGSAVVVDDGNPQYGDTVWADTSNVTNNSGELVYQWTRNGVDILGQNNSTYALVQEDIGKNIAVVITSTVEEGKVESKAVLVGKADREAPDVPILKSKDEHQIIIRASKGCEYKIEGGSFKASNMFNNLNSYTEYVFYLRYKETETHNASPASVGLAVTTDYFVLKNVSCDISKLKSGDGVLVEGNVTMYGTQKIRVFCSENSNLTLSNATINIANMKGEAAIKFLGSRSHLILKGSNKIYSGGGKAGIEVSKGLSIFGGGSLYVKGGMNAAGIGGSSYQDAGDIKISGGTITAQAGYNGAGIGGGYRGAGGNITIAGGKVYAIGGEGDDVGSGKYGSQGTLYVSDTGVLFLKNDSAPTAITSTHDFYSDEVVDNGMAYGVSLPNEWKDGDSAYAYIDFCKVTFNTDGGGRVDSQKVSAGTKINKPTTPVRTGLYFGGWYKDKELTEEFDVAKDKVYNDMVLYAAWDIKVIINVTLGGMVTPNKETFVRWGGDLELKCEPDEEFYINKITSQKNYTVVKKSETLYVVKNMKANDTVDIMFDSDVLFGTVTIDNPGAYQFGEELTANTDEIVNNPETAELEYQWLRDNEDIEDAVSKKYSLRKEDIGHKISVKVTSTEKEEFVVSEETVTITKASKPAPQAPTLLSKTNNSVTLKVLDGCEYKIEGKDWQESNVFDQLESDTEYTFYQRYAESETHKQSNISFSIKISTKKLSGTKIDIVEDEIKIHKGKNESISSVIKYKIFPDIVEDDSVTWESSNKEVAVVDNTNGMIIALEEGKTIITVTLNDNTNGVITDTCILQVYDPTPTEGNVHLGSLSGKLTDSQGNILSGYNVTLYSNPITTRTNEMGEYYIEYVPYTNHLLVVEDENNNEIGRFTLYWNESASNKASVDNINNIISINHTSTATSISIPIEVNSAHDDIGVSDANVISIVDEQGNDTNSKKVYMLILMGIIAACIIGVGYILYIGRIRKEEYYNENVEDNYDEHYKNEM